MIYIRPSCEYTVVCYAGERLSHFQQELQRNCICMLIVMYIAIMHMSRELMHVLANQTRT